MSEATPARVLVDVQDRVMTIRLNRPDKKNALTQAMYLEIVAALEQAAADDAVRVVLFAGTPEAFTAGNDLEDFLKKPAVFTDSPVGRFIATLSHFPKAVVAAVNGPAIGIGVTMLLHCDLVYAGDGARFQMPFVNIGLCPEFASSLTVARVVGHARAAELLLLGESFSGAQAAAWGIANAVLPAAEVDAYALKQAQRLAQQPPNALRVAKQLMKRWDRDAIDGAVAVEAEQFAAMLRQPEAVEAMTAFLQKRKPDFSAFK